ncbi:hypothetical protein [Trinickia terrae]|nr:hypothetical protein [Trinickia terrae]
MGVALAAPGLSHAQVTSWVQQMERMVSSLGVVTKQLSASASNSDSMRMQAEQAFQSTMGDAATTTQVRQIVQDFGPNGQLIDSCYQLGMAAQVQLTESKTSGQASSAMARLYTLSDSGVGSAGGVLGALGGTSQVTQFPFAASVAQRVSRQLTRYCTVSQAQLGYCTLNPNGMQAGDADFSLHLQPGKTYGWDQTEASTDFIKTIAPIRPTPTSQACTSTACIAARQARIQQETMMSMARYSFFRFTEAHETQKVGEGQAQ